MKSLTDWPLRDEPQRRATIHYIDAGFPNTFTGLTQRTQPGGPFDLVAIRCFDDDDEPLFDVHPLEVLWIQFEDDGIIHHLHPERYDEATR